MGSAFDYHGPQATLVKAFKYGHRPFLAKGMAAFMVVQFFRLEWPFPDLIIPIPQSITHYFLRRFHHSFSLATEMGKLLQRPVDNLLKRRNGDFSQACLSYEKRNELFVSSFLWKKRKEISDLNILLIDDMMTTGATMRACATILKEGCPKSIYGLVFCS
jgi:predicted amidophosphoribosyltransferase